MYYLKEWHMVPSPSCFRWKEGVAFVQYFCLGVTNIYNVNLRFGENYRHYNLGVLNLWKCPDYICEYNSGASSVRSIYSCLVDWTGGHV